MFKILPLTLVALIALSACNTVEGVGQDVEQGGEAISETANDAQSSM